MFSSIHKIKYVGGDSRGSSKNPENNETINEVIPHEVQHPVFALMVTINNAVSEELHSTNMILSEPAP